MSNLRGLGALKEGKHLAAQASRGVFARVRLGRDTLRARLKPFVWDEERFATSFAGRRLPEDPDFAPVVPVRRVIWGVWSGDNAMTPNRRRGWAGVRALNPSLECVLVTPSTLADVERPGFPIHPSYHHLSLAHRSDYLRAYLMHLHGGGYTDIKPATHDWKPFFDRLDSSDAWAMGYREGGVAWVGDLPRPLADLPRLYHRLLIGDGAFIMRPHSPITALWFDELHKRMDYYADDLARFPGHDADRHRRYPIRWTGILGDITGGVLLRYHQHLLHEPGLRPQMHDYR